MPASKDLNKSSWEARTARLRPITTISIAGHRHWLSRKSSRSRRFNLFLTWALPTLRVMINPNLGWSPPSGIFQPSMTRHGVTALKPCLLINRYSLARRILRSLVSKKRGFISYFWYVVAANNLRPFARRRLKTLRPPGVAMRLRKPWVLSRFKLLGWKVLFDISKNLQIVEVWFF